MTAAALVNELVEAEAERELSKLVARYGRLDLVDVSGRFGPFEALVASARPVLRQMHTVRQTS